MNRGKRVFVLPTESGCLGPLGGPFTLVMEMDANSVDPGAEAEILGTVVAFVRHVSRGVSCYNSNGFENSSNLNSYAAECLADLQSEAPEVASRLQSLVIDCSRLPAAARSQSIWKLDRAILRTLPGVSFIE